MSRTSSTARRPPREKDLAKDADKLIRRLSLVAFLLTRGARPASAEQIRARVEGYPLMTDDAFKRRFYEDRTELRRLGITIHGESDAEGTGELYSLPASDYYLPAIDLTREELLALGSCLLVLEERFAYSRPLRLSLLSLAQGRPELLGQHASPPIALVTPSDASRSARFLPRLQTAIADRKSVRFDYYSIGRDEVGERTVDPYGILLVGDEWYVVGRCHLRDAPRTFRLSRIRSRIRYATRRPHDFEVPADFSLADYRDRPPWQLDEGGTEATIRIAPAMAWWVEAHYAHCGRVEPLDDGGIRFTTRYASPRPLVAWALGLGEAAEIIAPARLRVLAGRQLDTLLDRLDDPPAVTRRRGRPAGGSGKGAGETADRRDWQVDVDRFTRLTALASFLLAHCGEDALATLPVEEVCAALGTTPAELRADIRLLNLVNFGGDGALLYAEVKHRVVEVYCDLAGQSLAQPARLSPLQADTLLLAAELLAGQSPAGPPTALRTAVDKVRAARHGEPPAVAAADAITGPSEMLTTVNIAIQERHPLAIEYWSEGRDEVTRRTVEPHLAVRQRGEWYYVSYCRRSHGVRTFRLSTTRSMKLCDERFEPRPEVQSELFRQEGIPTSREYAPQSASVWYSPLVCRWIAEHDPVEPLADGAGIGTLPYVDTPWLVSHLLRLGGEAVPLSPPDAVAALREAVVRLRDRYPGHSTSADDDGPTPDAPHSAPE